MRECAGMSFELKRGPYSDGGAAAMTGGADEEFYATFYPQGALSDAHREHMHAWHSHA